MSCLHHACVSELLLYVCSEFLFWSYVFYEVDLLPHNFTDCICSLYSFNFRFVNRQKSNPSPNKLLQEERKEATKQALLTSFQSFTKSNILSCISQLLIFLSAGRITPSVCFLHRQNFVVFLDSGRDTQRLPNNSGAQIWKERKRKNKNPHCN